MSKKIIAIAVLMVILFVSAIAGTIFYCNGVINNGNSKIASLNAQVTDLDSQILNLTSANLVAELGVTEVPYNSPNNYPTPLLYNHLYISGSVTNTGQGIANSAGLHVVAYAANGMLEVNMTVPLVSQENETGNEITDFAPVFGTNAATQIYGNDSLQLGNLYSGQTLSVSLGIFHEGTVTNWTITPVWTTIVTTPIIRIPTVTPKPARSGVLSYCFNVIFDQDSKIAQLNTEKQNLEGQLTNLTTSYLLTALEENEIVTSDYSATKSIPYNYLYVSGTVTNIDGGKAFNAGLHVVAYTASGVLEINMTFPLIGGTFGTDSKTDAYVTSFQGSVGSLQLGNLAGGETVTINIQIFHEGIVSSWTVTPVWTNTP